MKKTPFIFLLLLASCGGPRTGSVAVPDETLAGQLRATGYLRSPLPLDLAHSAEAEALEAPVEAELPLAIEPSAWSVSGPATLSFTEGGLLLEHPLLPGNRASGPEGDSDYAVYGTASLRCNLSGADLSEYNRIVMHVRPESDGAVCGLNLSIAGSEPHLMNLRNHEDNEVLLDLTGLNLSSVRGFNLHTSIRGRERATGTKASFLISDIRFQRVSDPESRSGWQPSRGRIVYSMSGYFADGPKTAIIGGEQLGSETEFRIVDESGRKVFSGKVRREETSTGVFGVLDFSGLSREGRYSIRTAHLATEEFEISSNPFAGAEWKVLNGIFGQRCGYSVPGVHEACHRDLLAVHGGGTISYGGGWHDAGDLSQQTLQTGDVAFALVEAWQAAKDSDPVLAARLLEEARWGLDFILRTRFGDGWRASSMGLLHWTDGVLGTFDDITSVRTQNLAFDNYLYAAYEAHAAAVLSGDDPALKAALMRAAIEDFAFAEERFRAEGFEPFRFIMEHSYNTSRSQYMATVSWAASKLFALTGEKVYADRAAEAAEYFIGCQQQEPLSDGTAGFFWRDPSRRSVVHYIHQSRDQVFAMALAGLCETQPSSPSRPMWEESMRLYASYLKSLMRATAPYGMLPSGVYRSDEYTDSENFGVLHIFAPADAPERYVRQFSAGLPIGDGWCIRRFPIWFNIFSGNNAVILSTGKAAAVCGNFLGDDELLAIGREQLYWIVGKNPFCQSMIYGEGHRYPQMSAFSSGELTGELPVGIRSLGDTDEPSWPAVNNACYKEVWLTSSGKFLSLLSEYLK